MLLARSFPPANQVTKVLHSDTGRHLLMMMRPAEKIKLAEFTKGVQRKAGPRPRGRTLKCFSLRGSSKRPTGCLGTVGFHELHTGTTRGHLKLL